MLNIADAAAIKVRTSLPTCNYLSVLCYDPSVQDITMHRARWVKPVEQYILVMQFGRNIVATEGMTF